jgi:hypothetical protein
VIESGLMADEKQNVDLNLVEKYYSHNLVMQNIGEKPSPSTQRGKP